MGEMKVSPTFSKAAGSQGSALSRVPQDTKSPFDSDQRPESTKIKKKKARLASRAILRGHWPLMEKTTQTGGLSYYIRFCGFLNLVEINREVLRSAKRAFERKFYWNPGRTPGFKRGVSRLASRDSGLCPKNPQTFEKV